MPLLHTLSTRRRAAGLALGFALLALPGAAMTQHAVRAAHHTPFSPVGLRRARAWSRAAPRPVQLPLHHKTKN